MPLRDLIPDALERERWIVRSAMTLALLIILLLVACWPGWHRRGKLKAANRAIAEAEQRLRGYAAAHQGVPPGHWPMRHGAQLYASLAEAGGRDLTTFDTSQTGAMPLDPLSVGGGRQPLVYFHVAGTGPGRWLIASVGLDGVYQLQGHHLAGFATGQPAALTDATYDPTNGTRSSGDMIRTGP